MPQIPTVCGMQPVRCPVGRVHAAARPERGRQTERMSETGANPAALGDEELRRLDAYWRAANFLSVGQIYLLDNPLLREPLTPEHVKPRLLGHFGTAPGLNLVYAHLNRAIRERELDAIFVTGPGHGGPANRRERLPRGDVHRALPGRREDEDGLRELFRQFSFPGGIPSHAAPETPGSIHEGGELGYALVARVRRRLRQPRPRGRLRRRRRRGGDRPARGELALEQVPQPAHRRRRAPDPAPERLQDREPDRARADSRSTSSSRCSRATAGSRSSSTGGFDGTTGGRCTQRFAAALDEALDEIAADPGAARAGRRSIERPRWPMLVLRTPKGWTGPKEVDGKPVEGTWRAHQVPLASVRENTGAPAALEEWLRSYRPEELFDERGRLVAELAALAAARASGG